MSRPGRPRRLDPRLQLALLLVAVVIGLWQLRDRPPSAASAPIPGAPVASDAGRAAAETYDLAADESRGGHTLARHVGRSDAQLRDRLAREHGIGAASTYTDRATAERIVARTLRQEQDRIASWLAGTGRRPNLALSYRGPPGEVLGRSLRRGRRDPRPCADAVVVLRWDGEGSAGYYVLTSYPEARR